MLDKNVINQWVDSGPTTKLIAQVEDFGRGLKHNKLSTSQIRQVFTRLKSIEAKGITEHQTEFLMLKPFISYAASRFNARGLQDLKQAMDIGIDKVMAQGNTSLQTRFANFCSLFEAILAYHKAEGGN
mgnify:CR=1 FL=1